MLFLKSSSFGEQVVLDTIDWIENFSWARESGIRKKNDVYEICLRAKDFGPKEITVNINDGFIIVEGKHEEKQDEHGFISRHFVRRFALPEDSVADKVESTLSPDGLLIITLPRKSTANRDTVVIPVTLDSKAKSKL